VVFDILTTIIVPVLLVVVAGVALGRRKSVSAGDSDSDSVSFAGGVISALFTVVLAFYIVFAWQAGDDVATYSDTETDALVDAYWQAESMPEPDRSTVQDLLRSYAQRVVGTEWDLLAQGRADPEPAAIIRTIRADFAALPADDNVMQSTRDNGLADVRAIDESHRARVDLATQSDPFNTVLLVGTLVGAALMIAFPLLVGMSARPANIAVLAMLTFTIGATVTIAIQLTHPLDGPFGADPDAFREALVQMQPAS
jgi:hypothetical protein